MLLESQLRRRFANDWQKRYRRSSIGLGLALGVWVLLLVTNLLDRHPFWPREALSLLCWTLFLGIMIFQWRHARRKAAKERPMPLPAQYKLSGFFWQAVLILLPVVIMAVIALISLRQDRVLAKSGTSSRRRNSTTTARLPGGEL
jgi:hypothetical protein